MMTFEKWVYPLLETHELYVYKYHTKANPFGDFELCDIEKALSLGYKERELDKIRDKLNALGGLYEAQVLHFD